MSKPIGFKGLKRISQDAPGVMTFVAATAATKVQGLDPTKKYAVICSGAGPSDVTIAATMDSKDMISYGTAKYAALKTYAAMAAAGGFAGIVTGVTGVKVTHVKNGGGTDDAPTVAILGGRFQVRFVESIGAADSGLGAYTPLTAT